MKTAKAIISSIFVFLLTIIISYFTRGNLILSFFIIMPVLLMGTYCVKTIILKKPAADLLKTESSIIKTAAFVIAILLLGIELIAISYFMQGYLILSFFVIIPVVLMGTYCIKKIILKK